MRDLTAVIDQMLAVIPGSEWMLVRQLESTKRDLAYVAPEAQMAWWKITQQTLMSHIKGSDFKPWEEKVISIWVGDRGGGVLFNPGR